MSYSATPRLRLWAVLRSGAKRALKAGLTETEAWTLARKLARRHADRAFRFDRTGRIRQCRDFRIGA